MGTTDLTASQEPEQKKAEQGVIDVALDSLRRASRSPAFWPGIAIFVGIVACYWSMFKSLQDMYNSPDGYYSHGWLVPFISMFIVIRWWPKLKTIPVRPGWFALVFLIPMLVVFRAARITDIQLLLAICFLFTLLLGTWLVAGFRWMAGLAVPILYLGFGLPLFTMAIDNYTNPLQKLSTVVAVGMLKAFGMGPYQEDTTTIFLEHSNFVLDVGVPCSGFKLVLAVTAFTVLFMCIGRLKWWGNLIMMGSVLPLCLAINGLRISLIGVVGGLYGSDAGHAFHDYSGYLTLIVCFIVLFKMARWLGWKD